MSTEKKNSPANNFSISSHPRPYPGLRPFCENEPDIFFGRDKQVNDIIGRLSKNNVAAILGGSGCGKSSLVRAGVIPALRSYGIPNRSDTWVPVTFTPGVAPLENLALELNRSLTPIRDDKGELTRKKNIAQTLRAPNALSSFFEEYKNQFNINNNEAGLNLGERANLLVLVDQFEEVFRPQNTAAVGQIQLLIKLITECFYKPHKQVFLILTMRSEYLERCANYPKFADVLNEVSFLTRRLEGDELIEVIIQPARRYAAKRVKPPVNTLENNDIWPFEESVKIQLLRDVNALRDRDDTDHLPLLQHYLFWLWHTAYGRWDKSGTQEFSITQADMDKAVLRGKNTGSLLKDCLNNQAQYIFDNLTPTNRQKTAEKMFRLLAELENNGKYTRRWTNIQDIFKLSTNKSEKPTPVEESEIREQIVKPFMSPHEYLRMEDKSDADIDVAHEALIRNWGTFGDWLKNEKMLRDAYVMLLEESNKPTKPRKHWFSCSEDLLEIKQINLLKSHDIHNLGFIWAQRYHDDSLIPQEKNSINKPISSDVNVHPPTVNFLALWERIRDWIIKVSPIASPPAHLPQGKGGGDLQLYQKAVEYFKKSEDALKCKKRLGYLFYMVPLLIILLIYLKIENLISDREINLFQPYAVANALRGSAVEEPEWNRLIRFQQLAVALRAIEKLEKNKHWSIIYFEKLRLQVRLERLERLARSATDASVRYDLEALVPSIPTRPTEYISPPQDKKPSDYDASDTECVMKILHDYSKNGEQLKETSLWVAEPTKPTWSPLLIRIGTEYLFGVRKKDNNTYICEIVERVPVPPNIENLYHDNLLQLMIWKTAGNPPINIARINWYYFAEQSNNADKKYTNNPYQFDFKRIGYIVDDPNEKIDLNTTKISSNGNAFSIVRGGEEKQYQIHVADSLEPVEKDNHDFDLDTQTDNDFKLISTKISTKLSYKDKTIYEIPIGDKAIITRFAYRSIDDGDNKGYLAFTVANNFEKTSQTLTILRFDKRLFNAGYPDDVKIEIAKFAFRRPPVTKIAFGKDKDDGWLFFETETEQKDQKAYYGTAFEVRQMRKTLCDIIGEYPKDEHKLPISKNLPSTTSTYQVLDKSPEGVVRGITHANGENGDECTFE